MQLPLKREKDVKRRWREEAKDKILALFKTAETKTEHQARELMRKVRHLALRHRIRLEPVLKRRFCKYCLTFFHLSKNSRVRLIKKRLVYTCFYCKRQMRIPYKRK
ncbi:TPA: hypothetical protein HA249_03660 [Candidatus Woesearchaeota archaeon]|nr:hypothetical protein [Candidatus Woesearchaeota archaeon]HIH47420.1 hypothetical protein [Candidatus Woesearchaeota archaeon]HII88036.1 hypothetical protein [Candidatus Woesearchaeota archaeon]